MNSLQHEVRRYFWMEMVGAGMYRRLAEQYRRKEPLLGERFKEFADQEHRHGLMFSRFHHKEYGRELSGGQFCACIGAVNACMIRPVPLKVKMKMMSAVEALAVKRLEGVLVGPVHDGMRKIFNAILPDEKAHANLYLERYPA